jgi:hypothetical protein
MVTRQALNDAVTNGVFVLKNSFTSDSRLVTKSMAESYVYINTISGYSSSQLVPKSAFVASVNYRIYGQATYSGYPNPFTSSSNANAVTSISAGMDYVTFSSSTGVPQVGQVLTGTGLTAGYYVTTNTSNNLYYNTGGKKAYIQVNSSLTIIGLWENY